MDFLNVNYYPIKSSVFVSIHPAGTPFVVIFSFVTVLIGWIWSPLFFIGVILTIWCIYFFRNPNRFHPDDKNNKLASHQLTERLLK